MGWMPLASKKLILCCGKADPINHVFTKEWECTDKNTDFQLLKARQAVRAWMSLSFHWQTTGPTEREQIHCIALIKKTQDSLPRICYEMHALK